MNTGGSALFRRHNLQSGLDSIYRSGWQVQRVSFGSDGLPQGRIQLLDLSEGSIRSRRYQDQIGIRFHG